MSVAWLLGGLLLFNPRGAANGQLVVVDATLKNVRSSAAVLRA